MRGYIQKRWILAVLWMAIIFALSSVPGWFFESIQMGMKNKGPLLTQSASVVHFVEYVLLGALLYVAFRHTHPKRNLDWLLSMVLLIGMVFAFLDESHQLLVQQRSFQAFDLLMDFMGLLSVCGYVNMKTQQGQ